MDPKERHKDRANTQREPVIREIGSEFLNDFHEVDFDDFNEPIMSHKP